MKSPKTRNKILLALSGSLSNAITVKDAIEKIEIFNSLTLVPPDILESLKQQIIKNKRLVDSKELLNKLNLMLEKFNVEKLKTGNIEQETHWDDIPF